LPATAAGTTREPRCVPRYPGTDGQATDGKSLDDAGKDEDNNKVEDGKDMDDGKTDGKSPGGGKDEVNKDIVDGKGIDGGGMDDKKGDSTETDRQAGAAEAAGDGGISR
jgi:hypothetical protein